MASTDDDRVRRTRAYQLIHHFREDAHAAIKQYNENVFEGQVPTHVQKDLSTAALNYYNALHSLRDEDALEEPWDERGITWLDEADGETRQVETSLSRANGATTVEERPLLQVVDPALLVATIRELDDVARELGLGVRVEESTPRTDIPDELFEEVEEWRQRKVDQRE